MPTTAETPATIPIKTTRSVVSPSPDNATITPISILSPFYLFICMNAAGNLMRYTTGQVSCPVSAASVLSGAAACS